MRKTRIGDEYETEDNIVKIMMRKRDSFKDNNDVYYNDDEYEDIGTEREIKIGQEDEENED